MPNFDTKIRYTQLFINNEFVDGVNGKKFPTINPTTGQKIIDVCEADKDDVELAVKAAKRAFSRQSEWRQMDASKRGLLINNFADLIERNIDYLAYLETLDNGKTLSDSLFDMKCSIDVFRYYGGICDKIHGKTIPSDGEYFSLTRKEPVGVVAQIIPWNYPFLMLSWKWGPALAAGCTTILKPAEQTPLTALMAAALTKEAGFPNGVINVLTGYGPTVGAALALHKNIDKVAFTGSIDVGRKIMEYSARSNLKKVSLELGGKSPLIIFRDVDLDEAVQIAYDAIFTNHGQNCCAGSRTFVEAPIYEAFVKKAAILAKNRKVGDPFDSNTQQGPQTDQLALDKVLKMIESGRKEGARLVAGGNRLGNEGYFVEPTVFADVEDSMTIAKEEIFGPVQSILKFENIDEVIDRANNTTYGLAAGVLTKDINKALICAQALQAGSVWVNCYESTTPQTPFGGYKMSGFGRDLGEDSLEPYLEIKTISIKVPTKV